MDNDTALLVLMAGLCWHEQLLAYPRRLFVALRFYRCGYRWRNAWALAEGR